MEKISDVFKCLWEGAIREEEAEYAKEEDPPPHLQKAQVVRSPDQMECSTERDQSQRWGGKPPPLGRKCPEKQRMHWGASGAESEGNSHLLVPVFSSEGREAGWGWRFRERF